MAAAGLAAAVHAARSDTALVSLASDGPPADGTSGAPSISADGRYVAFRSVADNLSSEDDDSVADIFVRDLVTGTTTLVSRASDGTPADSHSSTASISADGRYVAFVSDADNLSSDDDDSFSNVFVRDLIAGATTLVSRASDGTPADGHSSSPSISADGRSVAFVSDADNLSSEDDDSVADVFVRDLESEATILVSRVTDAEGVAADGASNLPSISADGRYVAFASEADNLSGEDDDTVRDIFVRDLVSDTTTYASRATGAAGAAGDESSFDPSISGDGRYVAFGSTAGTLSDDDDDALIPGSDVFVRDLESEATILVSRASGAGGAGGDAQSDLASISADGRYVTFTSLAANLVSGGVVAFTNVFVRDLASDTTTLASREPDGTPGDELSGAPSISADGRYVAFESHANNLSSADDDSVWNIFRYTYLKAPPVNVAPPSLSGQPVKGQALACSSGTWTEGAIGRQWRRDGAAIAGATGSSYTLTDADVGTLVDCLVTATNADGSASSSTSAALVSEPLQGPAGGSGPQGEQGPAGEQAPQGEQGPAGDQGPQGEPGEPAIKLLALLASDRFRARSGRRLAVRLAISAPGKAMLVLRERRGRNKTTLRKTRRFRRAGMHKLKIRLKRGRKGHRRPVDRGPYKLKLVVTGDDGQKARDAARVRVKRAR